MSYLYEAEHTLSELVQMDRVEPDELILAFEGQVRTGSAISPIKFTDLLSRVPLNIAQLGRILEGSLRGADSQADLLEADAYREIGKAALGLLQLQEKQTFTTL